MGKMGFIRHIPNSITSLNLISGIIAISFAFHGQLSMAGYLILAAAVFDFFDGLVARALGVHSEIGKQLDSLADMVSFGVAPAIIMLQMMAQSLLPADLFIGFFESFSNNGIDSLAKLLLFLRSTNGLNFWAYFFLAIPLLIAVFSALRLAKFNLDTRQTTSFIGLPTPANSIFILSLGFIIEHTTSNALLAFILHPMTLLCITLLFSFLLVCELPMFALKFKTFSIKKNLLSYGFILTSAVMLVLLKLYALPLIILLYIFISFVIWISEQMKNDQNQLLY